jgi:hypothetical protein
MQTSAGDKGLVLGHLAPGCPPASGARWIARRTPASASARRTDPLRQWLSCRPVTKTSSTRSFLHIPKSAGTSITTALEASLSAGSVSPKRQDTELLCGFTALDRIAPGARKILVTCPEEVLALGKYPVVSGHFSLVTLAQVSAPERIATVLRDPRARLLSHYTYWRYSSGLREMWGGYPPMLEALRPLEEFLAEPRIAQATDNLVCRMLLPGDSRIPSHDFIAEHDVQAVAADAIAVLATFGYVGVVEQPDAMWSGLSAFFGVKLEGRHDNATASEGSSSEIPAMTLSMHPATLGLINARSAADLLVYAHTLAQLTSDREATEISRAAFATQLLALGDTAGGAAQAARERARAIQTLRDQLASAEATTQNLHEQLAAVQVERDQAVLALNRWRESLTRSLSWRVTAPARAIMRRARRKSGSAD